jgi:hypothetical protein
MAEFRFSAALVFTAVAFCSLAATAAVSQAPTRPAIASNITVDWGQFGGDLTAVANGASFTSGAFAGTVGGASPSFSMLTGSTYNADFLPTDNVLALFDVVGGNTSSGSFVLTFNTPVFAAGAQVQANNAGAFSGLVSAFNSGGGLLGSFTINGSNGQNGTGSAAFAGIISDALDIKRLEFTGFGAGAAINSLSVRNIAAVIPEPAAVYLWLMGLAGVAALARRQTRV